MRPRHDGWQYSSLGAREVLMIRLTFKEHHQCLSWLVYYFT